MRPTISTGFRKFAAVLPLAPLFALTACRHSGFPDVPAGFREFAYVADSTGNNVSVLDLVYMRPDRTLAVGTSPIAEAVNPKRDEIYVVNQQPNEPAGSITVIDTANNTVAATIPVRRAPSAIVVDPTGHSAFVVNTGSNSVTVIDLDTRKAVATVPTGKAPDSVAISSDARTLVVTNRGSGSTSLFSVLPIGPPLTLRATFPGCPGASAAVILPDSLKTYIACSEGHQVMAIGLAAAYGSWAASQDAALSTDHLLALLDVGKSPAFLSLKPDGGEIFVSNTASDSISEISTTTNEVGSTFAIGDRPHHGVIDRDGNLLWVAINGADSLSLYSIADGKVVTGIRTGPAPNFLAFSDDYHLLLAADTQSGDVAVIRTTPRPAFFTILPAGRTPSALVTKAMHQTP